MNFTDGELQIIMYGLRDAMIYMIESETKANKLGQNSILYKYARDEYDAVQNKICKYFKHFDC